MEGFHNIADLELIDQDSKLASGASLLEKKLSSEILLLYVSWYSLDNDRQLETDPGCVCNGVMTVDMKRIIDDLKALLAEL